MEGRMKKALGLVGATLLFAGPALGADLGTKAPAYKAPPLAPIFSWTGFYVGGHGGYGGADRQGAGVEGGVGGGPGRGHLQNKKVVLGVEGGGARGEISGGWAGLAPVTYDSVRA